MGQTFNPCELHPELINTTFKQSFKVFLFSCSNLKWLLIVSPKKGLHQFWTLKQWDFIYLTSFPVTLWFTGSTCKNNALPCCLSSKSFHTPYCVPGCFPLRTRHTWCHGNMWVCVCVCWWVSVFLWICVKGRVYPANLFMFLYVLLSLKVLISEKLMRNNGFQWVIGPNPIFLQVQRFECITIWIKLSCLYCHSHRTYKGLCSLAGMLPSLSISPLLLKMISGPQYAHTIVKSRK